MIRAIGKTVRSDSDLHLLDRLLASRREDPHGVLAAVGGEDEIVRHGHQRARDSRQIRDRAEIGIRGAVDDVDRVIRGVGHVEPATRPVHGRVVEATGRRVRGKVDVADVLERHGIAPALAGG
jgi:hypothetical protein